MDALILLASYLIGSAPLGSFLILWATRRKPSEVTAHNLGVENLLYFVGAPVALASLLLDILKGFTVLALFAGNPWAALGVYAGHLYPLTWLEYGEVPRGRGNGVLLGILAGSWTYSGVPFWLTLLPLAVYAALLAWSRYVTLATVVGLLVLVVSVSVTGQSISLMLVSSLIFSLGLWRHKVGLARILDQTEPKLGEPPPVRGVDPNVVVAAFMFHPLTLEDVWQPGSLGWLKRLGSSLPDQLTRRAVRLLRPQKQSEIRGIRLADGRELRVMMISGAMFPEQIRRYPEAAVRVAVQGARLAHELGAEAFGLGAFWSTVGEKGAQVQEAVPEIHITNGGAYTAATVKAAVPGLLERFEAEGGALRRSSAAVVGANGVVAFGVARTIAPEVARLILIGRDEVRLERSAETLRRKYPQTQIETSVDIAECASADLIFSATSDPKSVLFAQHVKPGAWIFDLGRPADVDESVREVPGVHVIPGGVVRPPGEMRSLLDLHFGDGMVPACMAETMIMSATRAFHRKSLGSATKSADIDFYLREGARLGFEIVTRDERVHSPKELA